MTGVAYLSKGLEVSDKFTIINQQLLLQIDTKMEAVALKGLG